MKRYSLISLMAGIAFLLPVSCVREEPFQEVLTGHELILDIGVEGMATRAAGDPWLDDSSLREDAVDSLDIYIFGQFSSQGSLVDQVREYHLRRSQDLTRDGRWKVCDDWRDANEGYVSGNQYKIYVAANSKRIKNGNDYSLGLNGGLSLTGVNTLAALQTALKDVVEYDYDPTEPNIQNAPSGYQGTKPYWGAHNDDNVNPEWLDLHKKYIESPAVSSLSDDKQKRFYTNDKAFLMDGAGSFTIGTTPSTILLQRAAAKIILDVKFDNAFLAQFGKHPVDDPAWEFINFAFSTPVFDASRLGQTGSPYDGNSIFTAGALMMRHDEDNVLRYGSVYTGQTTGFSREFSLQTYSYPLEWGSETGDNGAPGIIISVNYKQNDNDPNLFQYYKIPIVDPSPTGTDPLTSLDRNKVYRISAIISSEGGNLLTEAYEVKCNFDILPWGDSIPGTQVDGTENMYFNVSPTEIILRGDGLQTADIKIIKPDNKKIGLRYFNMGSATFEEPFKQGTDTTTVQYSFTSNVAQNEQAPYYFNYKGDQRKVFTRTLEQGGVTYGDLNFIQNKFTLSQYGDKLTLESYHLPNRGIKYMKIRVNLDVPGWKTKKLYQDIIIRHYPTDYITSIEGSWASRKSAAAALVNGDADYKYHKEHNSANYGPEEYALNITGTTHSRDVYNGWEDDGTKMEYEVTVNRQEYLDGHSGSFPADFYYTLSTTTLSDYNTNTASDPLYTRTEETYNHYFHNDSGADFEIDPANLKAQHGSEANAYDNRSVDGWYFYWGDTVDDSLDENVTSDIQKSPGILGYDDPVESDFGTPTFQNPYDYYIASAITFTTNSLVSRTYHITFTAKHYSNHYRAKYEKPTYYCKEFSRGEYSPNTDLLNQNSLPDDVKRRKLRWVNYNKDFNNTVTTARANSKADYSAYSITPFSAKYKNGTNITPIRQTSSGEFQAASSNMNYSNAHIYIIHLSESSTKYTIGIPQKKANGLSDDKVVAPALMIASQLGATGAANADYILNPDGTSEWAATDRTTHGTQNVSSEIELHFWEARHCATYLEVGKLGVWEASNRHRYYFDWRLPTAAEIGMILDYQGSSSDNTATIDGFTIAGLDRILEPVMTAGYYRVLDGSQVRANTSLTTHTLRCVRELTLEELEYLANF